MADEISVDLGALRKLMQFLVQSGHDKDHGDIFNNPQN